MAGEYRVHTARILSRFAELAALKQKDLYRIWLVTPWITYDTTHKDPLVTLISAASTKKPTVIVITRPPEFPEHEQAIRLLKSHTTAMTYVVPYLHSKIYILQCDGFRAAFFGSPNFTSGGNVRNREIAIDFRTTNDNSREFATALINDLIGYVSDLRNEATLF